jgi:hypothetical protein
MAVWMFSIFGIRGAAKSPVSFFFSEQSEQSEQRAQSEQSEQSEQRAQPEQYEQSEQSEQLVQLLQFVRLSSAFCAASSLPKYSTLHLLPRSSLSHVVID